MKAEANPISASLHDKPLSERAKATLRNPRGEWRSILLDSRPVSALFLIYAIPLALIGPLANFLGSQTLGYEAFGFTYRPRTESALITAGVSFAASLLSTLLLAITMHGVARLAGEKTTFNAALRLAIFGSTALWLAGIFSFSPNLAVFSLLGAYSLFIIYTGIEPMLGLAVANARASIVFILTVAIGLNAATSPLTSHFSAKLGGYVQPLSIGSGSGKVILPGGRTVDLAQAERISRQLEASLSGDAPPVSAKELQSLLPSRIGDYARQRIESITTISNAAPTEPAYPANATPSGQSSSSFTPIAEVEHMARAQYKNEPFSYQLAIRDIVSLDRASAISDAIGIQGDNKDPDIFEQRTIKDDQILSEYRNHRTGEGRMCTVVANRFILCAEGKPASMADLQEALNTVDPEELVDMLNETANQ